MTRVAGRDIVRIDAWIESRGSALDARRWSARLHVAISTLANLPERCPTALERQEFDVVVRHLVFGDYRVLFTVIGKSVLVLRVRHARQEIATRDQLRSAFAEFRRQLPETDQ